MSWNIAVTIVGSAFSLIGVLIVLNLRSIKHCLKKLDSRIDKQDTTIEKTGLDIKAVETTTARDIKSIETSVATCKVDCHRTFVSGESFLRETGFARRTMETLTAAVNSLGGKLTVIEKLPQICSDISREIVKQMQNGGNKSG